MFNVKVIHKDVEKKKISKIRKNLDKKENANDNMDRNGMQTKKKKHKELKNSRKN